MLERVRNSMQSGFTYVLIAGLVVIFMFFFGMPSQTCSGAAGRQSAHLADVGGEAINTGDVSLLYNRVYGTDRSDEEGKYEQRRAKSLRTLILLELFADRAREEGFRVSTDELKDYITDAVRNIEYRYRYGQDGSFNGQYYKAYVQNRLRTQIEKYEAFKREELLARKYLATHSMQAAVPTAELERTRDIKETKLNLSFVALDTETVRDSIEIDDEAIQTYLEEHREKVETYYEDNKSEKYKQPERLRLRRVYIGRPGSSADKSKRNEAEKTWNEAKKRVMEDGEPLAEVAKDISEGYAAEDGGLMDWSTAENIDSSVLEALEDADTGDVKEVVTDRTYRLVKLEGRKQSETTPLEDVETSIAEQLLQKKRAGDFVAEIKEKLHAKAKKTGSLKKALDALRSESDRPIWSELSVEKTGEFTLEAEGPPPRVAARMGGRMPAGLGGSWFDIPKIGESKDLAVEAFKNLTRENPVAEKIYDVGGSKYVVRLASRTKPGDGTSEGDSSESDRSSSEELEAKKTSQLVGRWTAIFGSLNGRFVPPMNEYGPWIDRQLEKAIDDGTVQLYPKRSKIAQVLKQSLQPGGKSQPLKGLKGGPEAQKQKKKQQIQLKMGGKKGKGKAPKIDPEKLEKLKKKLKMKKKAAPKQGESAPGESEGTSSGGSAGESAEGSGDEPAGGSEGQ